MRDVPIVPWITCVTCPAFASPKCYRRELMLDEHLHCSKMLQAWARPSSWWCFWRACTPAACFGPASSCAPPPCCASGCASCAPGIRHSASSSSTTARAAAPWTALAPQKRALLKATVMFDAGVHAPHPCSILPRFQTRLQHSMFRRVPLSVGAVSSWLRFFRLPVGCKNYGACLLPT